MRKRTIHNWIHSLILALLLMFPLFHFFFFGMANYNQSGLLSFATSESLDDFFAEQYSWLSPYTDNLYNSSPVGLFLSGVESSDLSNDLQGIIPNSIAVYSMINWAVYFTVCRLLLAVFLFIPKFAIKLLNKFSANDEVL